MIQARALFRDPIEFKPQFKMVLTCNTLPEIPSTDDGTWRRIRIVEFISKFTSKPNPNVPTEFLADPNLDEKLDLFKETFMSLLIEFYKKYREHGLIEPEEVLKATLEYKATSDKFAQFCEQCCEKCDGKESLVLDAYATYKSWLHDAYPESRAASKPDFVKMMSKIIGNPGRTSTGNNGWTKYNIKYDPYGGGGQGGDSV